MAFIINLLLLAIIPNVLIGQSYIYSETPEFEQVVGKVIRNLEDRAIDSNPSVAPECYNNIRGRPEYACFSLRSTLGNRAILCIFRARSPRNLGYIFTDAKHGFGNREDATNFVDETLVYKLYTQGANELEDIVREAIYSTNFTTAEKYRHPSRTEVPSLDLTAEELACYYAFNMKGCHSEEVAAIGQGIEFQDGYLGARCVELYCNDGNVSLVCIHQFRTPYFAKIAQHYFGQLYIDTPRSNGYWGAEHTFCSNEYLLTAVNYYGDKNILFKIIEKVRNCPMFD